MNTQNSYHLLGARVAMCVAEGGYRAAIDPVLLAASVPVQKGERILDVGCGKGYVGEYLKADGFFRITGMDCSKNLLK